MKRSAYLLGALVLGFGLAEAQKATTPSSLLSRDGSVNRELNKLTTGSASSRSTTIVLPITGTDSWDGYLDTSNTIVYEAIPVGDVMTGIGWDVTISTVLTGLPGTSYLSEAKVYFDGSDQDGSGLFLTAGSADGFAGTGTYSSGGIIDLTDNGIPDIPILADGMLHIQFYEGYDDVADTVDGVWVSGTLTIVYETPVPPPCTGTPPVVAVFEDFDSGVWPPAGWAVTDLTSSGFVWDSATAWGSANLSGGTGECAVIDSDAPGSGPWLTSELITVAMDLPAYPVALAYMHTYQSITGDIGTVDINVNGAGWVNLATYTDDSDPYPGAGVQAGIDISAYAGATNVQFRFLYDDGGGWMWYWHVDDVGFYPIASSTFRNAGTNPASYTIVKQGVLGCDLEVEVDCGSTGHSLAILAGYVGSATIALPYGQTVLCDPTSPEYLHFPVATGPIASFAIAVPGDVAYAGFPLVTQAAHAGTVFPFLLTNAQDLTLGFFSE
jgi:hypothetical protein